MVSIKDSLFKEYDLRGVVGDELTGEVAYKFGLGYGSYVQLKGFTKVVVGYDNRLSSKYLTNQLIKGLLETGINVVNVGLVTTPMFYCAKYKLGLVTGIMVTASHNPKEYNGFKISFDKTGNAYGEKIRALRDYIKKEDFLSGSGILSTYDVKADYLELIKKSIDIKRKLKVVIDCGNGTTGIIVKDVFDMFNLECDYLYSKSDGNFPNHHPDPSLEKNMESLKRRVVELNYDLGIAFDGDGDRVGIVDNLGNFYTADYYLAIMSSYMKDNLDKLLFDVKCSKMLTDECAKNNIKPCMFKTGASYTNMEMQEGNFIFGGEYSGHLFFRDKWPGFDDGIYAGLRLIEMLSNCDLSLNEMLNKLNHYENEYVEYPINLDLKDKVVSKVKEYVIEHGYDYTDIDGVRVEFADGFALVRGSNTTPILTMRFEAKTKERLKEIKDEFLNRVKDIIDSLNKPTL